MIAPVNNVVINNDVASSHRHRRMDSMSSIEISKVSKVSNSGRSIPKVSKYRDTTKYRYRTFASIAILRYIEPALIHTHTHTVTHTRTYTHIHTLHTHTHIHRVTRSCHDLLSMLNICICKCLLLRCEYMTHADTSMGFHFNRNISLFPEFTIYTKSKQA